jgi:hypothetical protein
MATLRPKSTECTQPARKHTLKLRLPDPPLSVPLSVPLRYEKNVIVTICELLSNIKTKRPASCCQDERYLTKQCTVRTTLKL